MGLFSKKPKVLIVMVKYERMAGLASKDEIIKSVLAATRYFKDYKVSDVKLVVQPWLESMFPNDAELQKAAKKANAFAASKYGYRDAPGNSEGLGGEQPVCYFIYKLR